MKGKNIRISFTGDLLAYHSLIKRSKNKSKYDFANVFEKVKCIFNDSDYVVGNLETPLAGKEAGYTLMDMLFNTPDQFANDAKDAGFSMFTTANNHCMDKGQRGLERTIDILDGIGIDHTGTFKNPQDQRYFIKEINGVKFGFISFTYGTNPNVNGYLIDENNDYLVNLTKKSDTPYNRPFLKQFLIDLIYKLPLSLQNKIHPLYPNHAYEDNVDEKEIAKAVNQNYISNLKELITQAKSESDITFVCLHSGGQFNSKLGAYTQYLIDEIRQLSVDAIIVNHPHCVLGSSYNANHFEAWSLGNFCFTPGEGYFIEGVYGEYGIVVHLEIDTTRKKIMDVFFNVIKNVKLSDGREQVIPVSTLYNNLLDNEIEKEHLKKDVCNVINRFLMTHMDEIEIKAEYRYKDYKNLI